MISAGMLTERIAFLAPTTEQNEYGEDVTRWTEVYKCSARVVYNKGSRAISEGEAWLPNAIAITTRHTATINDRQRIRWDEKLYLIESLNRSKTEGSINIAASRIDEGKENGND